MAKSYLKLAVAKSLLKVTKYLKSDVALKLKAAEGWVMSRRTTSGPQALSFIC